VIKRLRQFNPDKDDYVAYVESDPNGSAIGADIDATVHYSSKHGFYLRRRIVQIRKGRVWITASRIQDFMDEYTGERRCLSTIRPMTKPETILLILESYLPDQEGVRTSVMEALSGAGVI
jgi:hypothetical protein